jgi:hypothetical protein
MSDAEGTGRHTEIDVDRGFDRFFSGANPHNSMLSQEVRFATKSTLSHFLRVLDAPPLLQDFAHLREALTLPSYRSEGSFPHESGNDCRDRRGLIDED